MREVSGAETVTASEGEPSADGQATFVVLPALRPWQSVVVFDDGSYCLDWVPAQLR